MSRVEADLIKGFLEVLPENPKVDNFELAKDIAIKSIDMSILPRLKNFGEGEYTKYVKTIYKVNIENMSKSEYEIIIYNK